MDNTNPNPAVPVARPTLLTVLCILSFIWAAFSIIGGMIGYGAMKMMSSGKLQEMMAQTGDSSAMSKFEEAQAKIEKSGLTIDQLASASLGSVALAIVALAGVIMMWKLRRSGFIIYLAAQLIALLLPLIMGGKLDMSLMAMMGMGLTLLFIILYALNLKHMH